MKPELLASGDLTSRFHCSLTTDRCEPRLEDSQPKDGCPGRNKSDYYLPGNRIAHWPKTQRQAKGLLKPGASIIQLVSCFCRMFS